MNKIKVGEIEITSDRESLNKIIRKILFLLENRWTKQEIENKKINELGYTG